VHLDCAGNIASERALHDDISFAEEPYIDASSSTNIATKRALQKRALQNNGCYAEEP